MGIREMNKHYFSAKVLVQRGFPRIRVSSNFLLWPTLREELYSFVRHDTYDKKHTRLSHSPTFVPNLFRKYLIWSPMISGYPKHNFFHEFFPLRSPQDPPKSEKVDFQVAPITLLMVL